MRCLICGKELNNEPCPDCGFDLSRCAELYPTLALSPALETALWQHRRALFQRACRASSSAPEDADTAETVSADRQSSPDQKQEKDDQGQRLPASETASPAQRHFSNLDSVTIGDTVLFGTYRQQVSHAEKTAIEWLVLDRAEEKVLLVSKYALDAMPFHGTWGGISWENSTLRAWLNNNFLHTAFSETIRNSGCILSMQHTTKRNRLFVGWTDSITEDKVFMFSVEEASRYFEDPASRRCIATAYADCILSGQRPTSAACGWWLRSSGSPSSSAAYVDNQGEIIKEGCRVDSDAIAVRPAIWIDLSLIQEIPALHGNICPTRGDDQADGT